MLSSSPSWPSRNMALLHLCLVTIATLLHSAPASAQKIGYGYRLVSMGKSPDGAGLSGYLQVKRTTETYGPDIPRLKLFVKHETGHRLRVHITDAEQERWEVPYDLLPREQVPKARGSSAAAAAAGSIFFSGAGEYQGDELVFTYKTDPFGFAVRRKSDGQTLFDTNARPSDPYGGMVFKDQYLEISTRLPGDAAALYGLGENTQPGGIRLRPNDAYTLYTTDISAINLNTDLYGSHPFYMDLRRVNGAGEASVHGVLLLNSNGMDVAYRGSSLTYKVIGGVFDFYFFAGPTPLAVVDQYTSLVGRPAPMPYWALAFAKWAKEKLDGQSPPPRKQKKYKKKRSKWPALPMHVRRLPCVPPTLGIKETFPVRVQGGGKEKDGEHSEKRGEAELEAAARRASGEGLLRFLVWFF